MWFGKGAVSGMHWLESEDRSRFAASFAILQAEYSPPAGKERCIHHLAGGGIRFV
jgi:hypothetical protein